ncbi:lytic murein transglycosylase B [Holophaga foetida]|uniref:lytic murein transglycosylase B n=1 Tax=Holophaga foetida TaxID=35839 RepID=UPI000247212F|nr:lytic murein transglycosylase B [Holophaga foetida]
MTFHKALFPLCLLGTCLLRGGYADRPEAKAFIQDLVNRHHFEALALRELLDHVQPQEMAKQWVKPPAVPIQKSWRLYRSRFIEPIRIRAGLAFWRQHRGTLAKARRDYGIPEEIIVGIIGVETIYGRNTGTFPVLDTLATLAFEYPEAPNRARRTALFLQELEAYLVWCRDTHQDPHRWRGSYTGAMGLPQFLPSSIQKWAVDFDGDGRIDLQASPADAIGSVAHYLKAHGWEEGRPVDLPVTGGPGSRKAAAAHADGIPEPRLSLLELRRAGVQISHCPRGSETQVLVVDLPSPGQATQYRIGFRNFHVLTLYNRSFFYASAVADLGRAVKARLDPPRHVKMKHHSGRP